METQNNETLASEMYAEQKKTTRFLLIIILILIVALAGTNIYHIYQWSQFDTIVVDSGDGSGNANYVEGDNTGGIFNGTNNSEETQEWKSEGYTN